MDLYQQLHPFWTFKITVELYKQYSIWRFNTTGVGGSTIANDISGINSLLTDFGVGINLHNYVSLPLIRIRRGIDAYRHKMRLDNKVVRRALINKILDPMLKLIPQDSLFNKHVSAALAVAKAAGLRASNYCWTKKNYHIRIKHVRFVPGIGNPTKVVLTLPYSKTNQPNRYKTELRTIKPRSDGGPCAVMMLKEVCRGRMGRFSEPVFLQSPGLAINYKQVSDVLTALCVYFGLDRRYYTPHALRIGAATDAHMKGVSLFRIMVDYNWKSRKVAMGYIRVDNEDLEKFE